MNKVYRFNTYNALRQYIDNQVTKPYEWIRDYRDVIHLFIGRDNKPLKWTFTHNVRTIDEAQADLAIAFIEQ